MYFEVFLNWQRNILYYLIIGLSWETTQGNMHPPITSFSYFSKKNPFFHENKDGKMSEFSSFPRIKQAIGFSHHWFSKKLPKNRYSQTWKQMKPWKKTHLTSHVITKLSGSEPIPCTLAGFSSGPKNKIITREQEWLLCDSKQIQRSS